MSSDTCDGVGGKHARRIDELATVDGSDDAADTWERRQIDDRWRSGWLRSSQLTGREILSCRHNQHGFLAFGRLVKGNGGVSGLAFGWPGRVNGHGRLLAPEV